MLTPNSEIDAVLVWGKQQRLRVQCFSGLQGQRDLPYISALPHLRFLHQLTSFGLVFLVFKVDGEV